LFPCVLGNGGNGSTSSVVPGNYNRQYHFLPPTPVPRDPSKFMNYASDRIRSCHYLNKNDRQHLLWLLCWGFKTKLYPKSWACLAKLRRDQIKITTNKKNIKLVQVIDEDKIYSHPQDKYDAFDLVALCDKYLSKQTKSATRFFTRPSILDTNSTSSSGYWYSKDAVGKNGLKMLIRNLATMCGLPMDAYQRSQTTTIRRSYEKIKEEKKNDDNSSPRERVLRRRLSNNTPAPQKDNAKGIVNIDNLILKAKNVDIYSNPTDLLTVLLWQFKTTFIARSWKDLLELDRHQVTILSSPRRIRVTMLDNSTNITLSYTKNASENKDNPLCVVRLSEMYTKQINPASTRFFNVPKENYEPNDRVKFRNLSIGTERLRKHMYELSTKCGFSYDAYKDKKYQKMREQEVLIMEEVEQKREEDNKTTDNASGGDLKVESFMSLLGGAQSDQENEQAEPDSFLV